MAHPLLLDIANRIVQFYEKQDGKRCIQAPGSHKGEAEMSFIRNQWYGAIWSQDLGDKPVARRILDKPIVLFRTGDGTVAALDDVCPHRFVPLSLGKVVRGNHIQCAYHGLEFDSSGACTHNPHTNGRIPPAARTTGYRAADRHGMIWVWLGEEEADPALIPDFSVLDHADPGLMSTREWLEIDANYTLMVDNLLDLSHACILHEGILGNDEMANASITVEEVEGDLMVRRLMTDVPPPRLLDLMYRADGQRIDSWADIRLMGVSSLLNHIGATEPGRGRSGGTGMYGAHILTPIDGKRTLYHFCSVRINPVERSEADNLAIRKQMIALRNMAFSEQDAVVMKAQQVALDDPAIDTSRPAMFDVDIGSTRYAQRIRALLKAEAGTEPLG